jgi:hypothetical protein
MEARFDPGGLVVRKVMFLASGVESHEQVVVGLGRPRRLLVEPRHRDVVPAPRGLVHRVV